MAISRGREDLSARPFGAALDFGTTSTRLNREAHRRHNSKYFFSVQDWDRQTSVRIEFRAILVRNGELPGDDGDHNRHQQHNQGAHNFLNHGSPFGIAFADRAEKQWSRAWCVTRVRIS